jgi:prevent-host-death family protein
VAGRWVQLHQEGDDALLARRRLHGLFQALGRTPRRIAVAEFRTNLSEVIAWAAEAERPIVVTSHGRPQAVVLSFQLFERILKGLALEVIGLRRRRSALSAQAEDVLVGEAAALNARLRGRA